MGYTSVCGAEGEYGWSEEFCRGKDWRGGGGCLGPSEPTELEEMLLESSQDFEGCPLIFSATSFSPLIVAVLADFGIR